MINARRIIDIDGEAPESRVSMTTASASGVITLAKFVSVGVYKIYRVGTVGT